MHSSASTPTSAGTVFHLIRTGEAATRAALARHTGASPSTMALRIGELIEGGYIEETGEGASSGGRRPRTLAVTDAPQVVAGVDLGENHAVLVLLNRSGETVATAVHDVSLRRSPDEVLAQLLDHAHALAAETPGRRTMTGIAVSLPGPVDGRTGRLLSPTRMPGWNGVDVRERLEALGGLPTLVGNDANSMAVGEFASRDGEIRDLLFVKAGSGIGCGSIVNGSLYTGFRGVAGDISHTTLKDAPPIACSCGRVGCLDMVASASAIVEALRERGSHVESIEDVLALARNMDPAASFPPRTPSPPGSARPSTRSACPWPRISWRSPLPAPVAPPAPPASPGSYWRINSSPGPSTRSFTPTRARPRASATVFS